MPNTGKLVVFEGPDGVGKSTLVDSSIEFLRNRDVPVVRLSFPGKDAGTLGWLVDQIHHKQHNLDLVGLSELSLQALHIAAHLDHIETRIHPALRDGNWVILDRFWWSTWVYGRALKAHRQVLETLIEAEKIFWAPTLPATVFLINRTTPFRVEHTEERFLVLSNLYTELANREAKAYPVVTVSNDSLDDSLLLIRKTLEEIS
jgi:dTMP kinase